VKRGDSNIGIMHERERLLALCAVQRDDLAAAVRQLDGPIKIADHGFAGARYLRDHPLVLGAVVAVIAVLRRRGPWKWAQRGFIAWRAYRAFGRSNFKSLF
jgi:hypothetical protein